MSDINYSMTYGISLGPRFASGSFSNTFSLLSSLNVREHASHPYSTIGDIIVLHILIFKFFERNLEDKNVWTEFPTLI